jgi:hypothetical protein
MQTIPIKVTYKLQNVDTGYYLNRDGTNFSNQGRNFKSVETLVKLIHRVRAAFNKPSVSWVSIAYEEKLKKCIIVKIGESGEITPIGLLTEYYSFDRKSKIEKLL